MTDETQNAGGSASGGAPAKRKKDSGPEPTAAAPEVASDQKPTPNSAELERLRARLTAKYHGRKR